MVFKFYRILFQRFLQILFFLCLQWFLSPGFFIVSTGFFFSCNYLKFHYKILEKNSSGIPPVIAFDLFRHSGILLESSYSKGLLPNLFLSIFHVIFKKNCIWIPADDSQVLPDIISKIPSNIIFYVFSGSYLLDFFIVTTGFPSEISLGCSLGILLHKSIHKLYKKFVQGYLQEFFQVYW